MALCVHCGSKVCNAEFHFLAKHTHPGCCKFHIGQFVNSRLLKGGQVSSPDFPYSNHASLAKATQGPPPSLALRFAHRSLNAKTCQANQHQNSTSPLYNFIPHPANFYKPFWRLLALVPTSFIAIDQLNLFFVTKRLP